ncbi:response regulator [Roseomonas genomospecies 6]|uniref:Response regulator n=1 Tax=Roseomonas genomospecies 6 TaxID=214106 RepID=A0A9W7NH37_9PROT|nr:response regulator [Roseomonas genomospecies 6]KAA0678456.1 response regulator [Roseomonas genomospecies 6]
MNAPTPPATPPETIPIGAYDVDALLGELSGDTREEPPESALCVRVEEVFTPAARLLMAEELAEFLETRGITPTEFLHKVEPQRSFLDWPRRPAILERVARRQARPGRRSPAMRLEELKRLEQEVLALTARRAHSGASLSIDAKQFAAMVAQTLARTPGFAGRYTVDSWLSAWLGEGRNHELRLVRILSLDGEGLSGEGIAILDQFVGEMLANGLVVEALFGWADGLRGVLDAMATVWRGEAPTHPGAPAVLHRLSAFIARHQARHQARHRSCAARLGLEAGIHHALLGDAPLSTTLLSAAKAEPNSVAAVLDELSAIALLSSRLAVKGGVIGGERTTRLLDRRVALLLSGARLEAVLHAKSHYARIVDLLAFEGAVAGERSRRMIVAHLRRHLEARDFTQRLFETARTPRARIKVLADLQRRVQRSTLPEGLRERYVRMLDEIQNTFLRTNRVFARIAKDRPPQVEEVMEFASLLAEGAFTEGKCAAAARDLVGHHVRSTAFLRAYLARCKEATEQRADRFAHFFATLATAGLPMRAMNTLRVLLADDEPAARGYVEMILRDLGITDLTIAEDGREALTRFEERQGAIDLIVCDWKMPGLSGLEFLKLVRAARPDMPFLMVTALATMIAVEEAMAHDVTAYIAKPFSPEQLEEKILVLVNRN